MKMLVVSGSLLVAKKCFLRHSGALDLENSEDIESDAKVYKQLTTSPIV